MPAATKWSDNRFLDELRGHCDAAADGCVAALPDRFDYAVLFSEFKVGSDPLPADIPASLRAFLEATKTLPRVERDQARFPGGVDHEQLDRGKEVFLDNAAISCLVLLAKAMPEGYSAPCLSRILSLSGNLQHSPFRRLLGVLQMVVDVMSQNAFHPEGRALVTAQKVRLMHAGIRKFVRTQWTGFPEYHTRYGEPVNLEDMLGTIMGLSLLVIQGMQRLHMPFSRQNADDYYYVWRVFAQMMGIHPPGDRDSSDWVPATLAEAAEFYEAYERRHYTDAAENPDGVDLAEVNLRMLEILVPTTLRRLGMQGAARFYMTMLVGYDACLRVGVKPAGRYPITRALLLATLHLWAAIWATADTIGPLDTIHHRISRVLLQGLVTRQYDGEVTFDIPQSLTQIQSLVAKPAFH